MKTINQALQQGRKALASSSESASLDAQVLLADLLGRPRSWVLAHTDERLPSEQLARFEERLRLCASGQPLPYVLGWWEFYSRRFEVTPAVLIPRPETELLVDEALDFIGRCEGQIHVADVGTGSGCIGVTLALEAEHVAIVAVDRSPAALVVARRNCQKHGVEQQVQLVQGDLLSGLNQAFDLVCANLPYIPSDVLVQLPVSKTEPRLALDGGRRGLEQITRLLAQLEHRLKPLGLAILEIGADQGEEIINSLPATSGFEVEILPDFAGKDRMLLLRKME